MIIDPPPSRVELVKEPKADAIWKTWFHNLFKGLNENYLRLDTANDPLTGGLTLAAGTTTSPPLRFVTGTLTTTRVDRKLKVGDRLATKTSGTLTTVDGVQVTVRLAPLGKGHYGQ